MNVEERKERGKSKKKWLNAVGCVMRNAGVSVDDVRNCVNWKFKTQIADPK